jgi:prevent-host-death family protein
MLRLATGIDSLTKFKRQTADFLRKLRRTGEPLVLTVNGKAEVVVQDAAAYQKLVDAAGERARGTLSAIREGLADVKVGRSRRALTGEARRNTASPRRINDVNFRSD